MTRKEAIEILKSKMDGSVDTSYEWAETVRMAIEALSKPKTIIGIDIPYGSDKGLAILFKGKNDKLILEEVKEIMAVVRCKDCIHQEHCYKTVAHTRLHNGFKEHWSESIEWCSRGKRKGGEDK